MHAMHWPVLGLVAVGLAISLPLTAWLVHFGRRAGALDSPGAAGHVKALRAVPNIGGIAIVAAIVAPMLAGLGAIWIVDEATILNWIPTLEPHLPRVRDTTPTALAMIACILALHIIGLIDDRRSLAPGMKLTVQFMTAAVMAIFFDVRLLTLLGPVPSIVITILWIVAVTNALNFMDNMDGLAGGVAAIAGTLFMIAALLNAQWFIAGTLALLVGALIGFLIFNFPPAKIFMGDGGSLAIGFVLAILTARTTYYNPAPGLAESELGASSSPGAAGGWYGVFMPLIVLAIPLYDFASVTIIRLSQGRSPFVGDQQHFSHRLVQRGLTKRGAVVVIWALTAVTGIAGISLGSLQGWQAILVGVQTLLVLMTLALLEHASRHAEKAFTTEAQRTQRDRIRAIPKAESRKPKC